MWNDYLQEYAKTRPECLHEWKSSPLANDHDFGDAISKDGTNGDYFAEVHQSQVIDLRTHKWSDVRKSYKSIINGAAKKYHFNDFEASKRIAYRFRHLHQAANGIVRNERTYDLQESWVGVGLGVVVIAWEGYYEIDKVVAGAYWIICQKRAYYMSGPSLVDNVQHAVIWRSLGLLRDAGVELVEMGEVGGLTEKEKTIGVFKSGFGGEPKPFTIVRRRS